MKEDTIAIRAHHLVCMSRSAAEGNSNHPTLTPILEKIHANPDRHIRVIIGPDDICLPCPDWDNDKYTCGKGYEELNKRKDAAFLKVLGFTDGQVLPACEIYIRISERVTLEDMKRICHSSKSEACAEAVKDPSVILGRK